jgi:hypothetical protein
MIQFKANYSRRVLLQLVILSAIIGLLMLINLEFITNIYFKNQATNTGFIVNGSILILFALGLFRIVTLLLRYTIEERALKKFLANVERDEVRPTDNISEKSLIHRRYSSVLEISKHNVAVNHSALASALMATESTHLSLPKFISNILILTGVFGTIISLSISLLGASNIIDSANSISGMSTVIHGMSTALSTTTTAIVCYLFFGYFYLKLTDVQTQILSGIEQATTLYIMPRFTYQTDSMLHEVGNLVKALHEAANAMATTQIDFAEAGRNLNKLTATYEERLSQLSGDIDSIKSLLQQGFRLPE